MNQFVLDICMVLCIERKAINFLGLETQHKLRPYEYDLNGWPVGMQILTAEDTTETSRSFGGGGRAFRKACWFSFLRGFGCCCTSAHTAILIVISRQMVATNWWATPACICRPDLSFIRKWEHCLTFYIHFPYAMNT